MHSSRTASRSARSKPPRSGILTLVVLVGLGCSGTGSGCSTLTPYPAGTHYVGPKNDNAINIRLSAGGINYLNANWQTLIAAFAPGGTLALPVGCSVFVCVPLRGSVVSFQVVLTRPAVRS